MSIKMQNLRFFRKNAHNKEKTARVRCKSHLSMSTTALPNLTQPSKVVASSKNLNRKPMDQIIPHRIPSNFSLLM